jgi:hypothetical protein
MYIYFHKLKRTKPDSRKPIESLLCIYKELQMDANGKSVYLNYIDRFNINEISPIGDIGMLAGIVKKKWNLLTKYGKTFMVDIKSPMMLLFL